MKSILIGLKALISLNLNAQIMNTPEQAITKLFVATDQQSWSEVESFFNENVSLDYSSMNGNPAKNLTPQEITTAWKSILPGFEYTHHQLGNFIVEAGEHKASVFCYGTASHYLENKEGNVWQVVGSYDFELIKLETDAWKITEMKFNFKYQDGNTSLPDLALNNIKPK
ncbi:nuclear transport factor 2 family protein [Flexithrix dorotheae]|uniref:nuclear transport factor 2 family protein n=1 Tax=Flexithrix dorotheae TaxID=70993 RepID=UPI00036CF331|nr:nuclear transport factor 2 family protein [Flexithrix dorotheae]